MKVRSCLVVRLRLLRDYVDVSILSVRNLFVFVCDLDYVSVQINENKSIFFEKVSFSKEGIEKNFRHYFFLSLLSLLLSQKQS